MPHFLKYWMDSPGFQDSLKEQSGGAAIQNVASVGTLKQIKFACPPLPEQHRIVAILDEAFDGIATAKANAENARALGLLAKAISGGAVDATLGNGIYLNGV
jgi:type I restriction enzyme S subunit